MNQPETHEYFRPSGPEVSGWPRNNAPNHRSPCPALNTLANHGYLPRDGKNITPEMVQQAVIQVFNIDKSLAEKLTKSLPARFTLADLGVHDFIEHDASLVHDDAFFDHDRAKVDQVLAQDLLSSDDNNRITAKTLAHFRRHREKQSAKDNPEFAMPFKTKAAAYSEAAALLLAFGDYNTETIPTDHAHSFLVKEKIPDDFQRAQTPITTSKSLYLAAKIKAMSKFS